MKTLKCTVLGLCFLRGNFFFYNQKYCDFLAELLYRDATVIAGYVSRVTVIKMMHFQSLCSVATS